MPKAQASRGGGAAPLMNKYNAVKRSTAPKRTTKTPADVQKAKKRGK